MNPEQAAGGSGNCSPQPDPHSTPCPRLRLLVAVLLGLLGAGLIWVGQPLNNFLLNNSFIADNYLPELGVAYMALLVLGLNPLLARLRPALTISVTQFALIFAILLAACSPLEVLRIYPHSLARSNRDIATDKELSDLHTEMNLSRNLYIERVKFGEETPACTQLVDELEPGNSIPWPAWLRPTIAWGVMIGACWAIMIGLSLIVYPQWRDNERLPFPLLTVQQALIERDQGSVPTLFRSRLFWVGFGVVMLLHAFNGLNHHTGNAFPPFALNWGLWDTFSEGMWRHLSYYIKSGRILFTIVGITYFVPNRVGFSLWFTVLIYQLHRMIGYEYFAPFHGEVVTEHRYGAMLGVALIILWLGRSQWWAVLKSTLSFGGDAVTRRNRTAGRIFAGGCLALFAWELWAGQLPQFALLSVAMVFLTSLVLARIVAETGIPFLANYLGAGELLKLMPIGWMNAASVYLTGMVDIVIREGSSRVSAAVVGLHALGIDRDLEPRQHGRLAKGLLGVLFLGFIIAGAVHLWMGYHYSGSLDGNRTPIAAWGSNFLNSNVHQPLRDYGRGSWGSSTYSRPKHLLIGAALGVGLQVACLLSPLWPLHPAGLLLADTWFIGCAWASILLGWFLKTLIIAYGSAQTYRRLRPLFLGLILGEVFSAVLWALVPVVLILLGGNPADVGHIVIVPQ